LLKEIQNSIDPKSELNTSGLTEGMQEKLEDYLLSLHGISDGSKEIYIGQVRKFGYFLMSQKIAKFEDIKAKDIEN